MSRAYGWNAQLLIAEESEYGVLPDSGYRQIPFISSSLDSEQSLVSSNVLGLGRDPTQPFQDVINVDGDMAIPIDFRNIGVWLRAIFGAPTTTNEETVYTHTFESGKISSELLANITSASATYSNNLEKIETIRNDGKVEAIDLGVASLTGSISAKYADNILLDKARAGTPVDIELGYQLSDSMKLVISCHEVYLPKPKRSIDGPGGIECSYDFQGAKDQTLGKMMTVTLVNDVEEY